MPKVLPKEETTLSIAGINDLRGYLDVDVEGENFRMTSHFRSIAPSSTNLIPLPKVIPKDFQSSSLA
jgi:hypothetical protein